VEKSKEKRMTNDKTLATIMLLKMLNIIQCWSWEKYIIRTTL